MGASRTLVLAIDGGTESARAGIFDLRGNLLASAAAPYTTAFPRPGWAEQDPAAWWEAVVAAVRTCLARAAVAPAEIAGLSLDATTCTLLPLGRDGAPLRPALLWMDVRASYQAQRIFATGHPALCYSPAGCNAEWMLSKALWLKEHEPATYAATAHFVEYTDWLIYRLTGRLVLNQSTATERWYYNGRTWKWPVDLYQALDVPDLIGKLPGEVLPPGAEVGPLLPEATQELGLAAGTRVFQGGSDCFVALLGLNVTRPGKVGLITGSSNVVAHLAEQEFHMPGVFGGFPDALIPGLYVVEAGQVSTGSLLAWFARTLAPDLPAARAFAALDAEAAQVAPGADGLIALDYFQGNRTPHTDSLARGAIWGLTLHTTRAHIYRALLEGIAFGTRQILQTFAGSGQDVSEVYACGGATHSGVFMQIYADVCGLTMQLMQVAEAALLGGAILAASGLGAYSGLPAAAAAMVRPARQYTPDPDRHEQYQFFYKQYCATYGQLRPLMHQAADHDAHPPKAH